MTAKVWISRQPSLRFVLGSEGPSGWDEVGEINSSRETDLWRQVQTYLGYRRESHRRRLDFYIDGDENHPWVLAARSASDLRFWLAIDVFGDGKRFLVARRQAKLATLVRRTPEAHPGLLTRPVFLGVRLTAGDDALFDDVSRTDADPSAGHRTRA
ncbi:hypothetical protein AB0B57_19350 [Micromonospora sp. NPDC049101]|uniref:hypothetical protein n=1 Tax=Micromonospora sp. NPDC049101 TaxID=3155032 RepID=UPI0033EDEABF